MKIVHLCLGFPYHQGYSYQDNLLSKHHAQMGHDVTIISSDLYVLNDGKYICIKDESQRFSENGCILRYIASRKKINSKIASHLRMYNNIQDKLNEESPNVIFAHGVAYCEAFNLCKYLDSHPNIKLYADNHGDYVNSARNFISKNILHRFLWKHTANALYKRAITLWGVTPQRCDFLREMYGLNSDKIKFLPMGIDDDIIPPDFNIVNEKIRKRFVIDQGDYLIVSGGKVDHAKNIHHLINAIKRIDNARIKLLLYGSISDEIRSEITPLLEYNFVRYVGWSSAEQVMSYLACANLCVYPGTHSTLWEQSVGIGKPCIFKYWQGMTHVNVTDNVIFVKGDDENELSTIIESLIFSEKYKVLLENAKIASSHFKYSQIAKQSINQLKDEL